MLLALYGLALLEWTGLIAEFGESLDEVFGLGLVGIVFDGHGLRRNVGINLLDTLLETEVILDLVLAVGAMHLRRSGHD